MSDNLSMNFGATWALNSGELEQGSDAEKIKTGEDIAYVIDGQFYSKDSTDDLAISYTGPDVYQAPAGVGSINGGFTGGVGGSTRLYLICLSTAGAVSIVPGPIVITSELTGGRASLMFPDAPLGVCPIGALRVALTQGTAFTPGTTDLDESGVTATFLDLATVPANPLTS
jgi:hypothetical protein